MDTRILATGLACLLLYFCLSTPPARALDAIPLYEPAPIGAMLRNLNPTAGVSSPSALNEYGDTVGRVIIDNQYHAFVYTEPHGVALLPMLPDWTSAVAVDITDPLDITGCDPQACVLIVGAAQSSIYGDPERALLWVYDVFNGRVVETVNVGVLPGTDRSTLNAVNNHGIAVGYSRGVLTPQQPMAYDFNTRRLSSLTDFPSNPVDINNDNWIVGGTFRSELAVDSSGFVTVGPVEDLRTSESPSVSQTTALNDLVSDPVEPGVKPDVIGVTPMGYHDGAGRMVIGAVRTVRDAVGVGWEVLWANSAFDRANDINLHRDVVGSLGVSSAIRPFLYIESLGQGFLLNDLIDPDSPYADVSADYGAYAVNDGGWVAAGASGAVLFKRIGNMLPPTPPANLSAVPHEPTWQQPWNAITLNWENTSGLTRHYTIERSVSGENSWSVIKSNWVNTQLWDGDGALGVSYDYRVRAVGLAGPSEPSIPATATFPADPVDRIAPTVSITSPLEGSRISGTVTIVADANDEGVGLGSVTILYSSNRISSRQICSASPGGAQDFTLSCNWRTDRLDPGAYTLEARASDVMGNASVHTVDVNVGEPGATTLTSQIDLTGPSKRSPDVTGVVTVRDGTGAAVKNASVTATWTNPSEASQNQVAFTDRKGKVQLSTAYAGVGLYTLTIISVTKAGYDFANQESETEDSITVNDGDGKGGKGGGRPAG